MKARTIRVVVAISNDSAKAASYSIRPVTGPDLGLSIAAFTLVNLTEPPHAVYTVRLALDGQTSCNCPQHNYAGQCKHADALAAAGVLPCALVGPLTARNKLLEAAEAEAKREQATVANLLQSVSNLTDRCELLARQLDEAQDIIQQLEKPKRRRKPAHAEAA